MGRAGNARIISPYKHFRREFYLFLRPVLYLRDQGFQVFLDIRMVLVSGDNAVGPDALDVLIVLVFMEQDAPGYLDGGAPPSSPD